MIWESLTPLSLSCLHWQRSTEAAGRSLVSIIVDHIFLCVKDPGLYFLS